MATALAAKGVPCFVELPAFERRREQYLDDSGYLQLQLTLLLDQV